MNITEIISVSPVNPAHGRHEVHAKNANGVPVTFTIHPICLGILTGYFDFYPTSDDTYEHVSKILDKQRPRSSSKKGS